MIHVAVGILCTAYLVIVYLSIVHVEIHSMEEVLKDIEKGSEEAIQASLSLFNSKVHTLYNVR